MRIWTVLVACVLCASTLYAQPPIDPPIQSDINTLQQEIQAIQKQQLTIDTRLVLLESTVEILDVSVIAVEARATKLEVDVVTLQGTPSRLAAVFSSLGRFFSNPLVITGIVTIVTCHYSGKC